ncbi:MAG: CoA-binding protein [Melioribacteraceae bacterium]
MENLIDICNILKKSKTIAVVGISDNPDRTSFQIAEFLLKKGYNVFGVNPKINSSGNIKVYPSLTLIPEKIDIVNVFRRSELIPELIPDILTIKPKTLWLQQGIRNDLALAPVLDANINTIQDKCIAVFYSLCGSINR